MSYLAIGLGVKTYIRNANPKELPRGDDGIEYKTKFVEESFEKQKAAQEWLGNMSVSFGEEGGSFTGTILWNGNTYKYGIVGNHDEKDVMVAYKYLKHKLRQIKKPDSWRQKRDVLNALIENFTKHEKMLAKEMIQNSMEE